MVTRELDNMSPGILRVKVSNVAAGEKITRLAKSKGWQVEVTNEGEDIVLTLRK
jgi:TusA-related sulfurtransferase